MKSYKVRREFAGLKEGEILKEDEHGEIRYTFNGTLYWIEPIDFTFLFDGGYIEETGKIAQEVGGEKKEEVKCVHGHDEWQIKKYGCETSLPPQNEWRPKEAERYWYLASWEKPQMTRFTNESFDKEKIEEGNFFRTESAALRAAEEIRNLLKKLPKE